VCLCRVDAVEGAGGAWVYFNDSKAISIPDHQVTPFTGPPPLSPPPSPPLPDLPACYDPLIFPVDSNHGRPTNTITATCTTTIVTVNATTLHTS
jgi:hypothetical protein